MNDWTVLLSDPAGADPGALARFFAARQKIPMIDAQRTARHSWGFLGRDLPEPEALALVQSASAAGLPAMAVETKDVSVLGPPSSAHGAVFEGDLMNVAVGIPSTIRPLPLSSLQVLSVASLRKDVMVTKTVKEEVSGGRKLVGLGIMLTTGIPVGMGKAKEVQQTTTATEWVMFLDIFGDGGRWRAVPSAFDFSGLGAEMGAGGPENLRRLLVLLHRLAPGALLNRGARWWLEGRPLGNAGYDEPSDVDQEARWLLTLSRRAP
ncbi:MAG: hypothetical protein IPP35_04360 [Elusimicrobia bacterium]|nr:hypothetical protein [Elusimicrobiota bacterium]